MPSYAKYKQDNKKKDKDKFDPSKYILGVIEEGKKFISIADLTEKLYGNDPTNGQKETLLKSINKLKIGGLISTKGGKYGLKAWKTIKPALIN